MTPGSHNCSDVGEVRKLESWSFPRPCGGAHYVGAKACGPTRVHALGRLVQHQQLGVVHHRVGEGQPLHHPFVKVAIGFPCGRPPYLLQPPRNPPGPADSPRLEQVGLADRREPIATFSKGMVQRLALAQAMVNDPELLVLDEPTEGMDLVARKLLHDVVCRHKAEGKTTILVSHSLSDVEQLCDRVAVLRGGQVAFSGG